MCPLAMPTDMRGERDLCALLSVREVDAVAAAGRQNTKGVAEVPIVGRVTVTAVTDQAHSVGLGPPSRGSLVAAVAQASLMIATLVLTRRSRWS